MIPIMLRLCTPPFILVMSWLVVMQDILKCFFRPTRLRDGPTAVAVMPNRYTALSITFMWNYAELMWEGYYNFAYIYVLEMLILNLQDDDIMKNIFNSGRNKNKVGMQIPAWMITDEMKLTEHYKMYAKVLGLDVPLTQSQPTESTQGTHRTPSALGVTNHVWRQLISLAEHKSRKEQEARENVALVYEHLAACGDEKSIEDPELKFEKTQHMYLESSSFGQLNVEDWSFYRRKEIPGPEKIVLSLHKFLAIVFNDDDIEERTSRWVNKCIKKFNPYARYGVENWKNPHAKIFYIRRQKEPGRPKEEIYSNSKIVQVIKTYWELGHEHKFITEIVARRANDCIVSITEPDYKNLNKNDIEDMYLLIVNNKVPDYANTGLLWSLSVFIRSSVIWERVHDFQLGIESYQQKINLTAPTITFPGIEEYDVFSIVYEPVHGIIYTNSKKEKRVMRHSEIHKFCDATLRRTLEGLKSYYNDVKYGYVQKELTNDEVEFLKLFEEEIEVRLNYRDQMRRWEMYVNGRPLGPRRERPE
ncbi:hypothetical protein Tco_1081551 [Tanacetum coccineum]|uniref:Uncharacterized protein n=1 Tax=Tanacetum coccineum TaxID=301880 RepID=A0ABQ5HXZ6_9ASTR